MRLGRIINYSSEGFDQAKEEGFEFIEICCNNQRDGEKLIAAKSDVAAQIKRTGIDVSSIGRWNHDVQAGGIIVPEKKDAYLELLDTSIELGARTFVCGCNYDDSISLWRNYCNAIELFGALTDRADGRIKVAIQNCGWNNFVVSPKHWEIILGELPELMLKFDASHAYKRGEDYLEQLSDWGERVAHFHLKGVVNAGERKVDDPPAGMDDLNWGAMFAILYARNYDGDLSIEPHSATWQGKLGRAGVEFTKNFVRPFMVS